MNISVVANPERPAVFEPIITLVEWATKKKHTVLLSKQLFGKKIDWPISVVCCADESEAIQQSDLVMTSGGDGTILWTARLVLNSGKKILGVNSGRMGFLANIKKNQLPEALAEIENNNYRLDKRFMLEGIAQGSANKVYALNEFLFSKKGKAAMITLSVESNGEFINKYWADGILISTPTGSTAYNLSSGGPIITPETKVVVLTPINPHNLTTRPLVLPADKPIRIKFSDNEDEVLFSNDGEISEITTETKYVDIRSTDFTVDLIQLSGQSYFETLRTKLMWGADVRDKL